jgi:glycosyltransferase involved in cell wall biosynthesis
MKILWVKTGFLHPTRTGGQIRTLETLRQLHRRHEIHFAALDLPEPGAGLAQISEFCTQAYPIQHFIPRQGSARYYAALARGLLFSRLPLVLLRYRSEALRRVVADLRQRHKFDAVVCDYLSAAPNMDELGSAILFQHNVESVIWRRMAGHARGVGRAFMEEQHRRIARYEETVCRRVKRIVAVSDDDAATMRSLYGVERVESVPTGVDLDYFAPPGTSPPKTDLVFVGSMDWRANIDGVLWFAREVLPLIRRSRPECSLTIVGRRPVAEIKRLAESDSRIHVTGTVEDVRPYLWDAAVSIVPLRIGGGTRLKIYESMAAKVPVLSTTVGAEGLDVRKGENIELADSPEAFAEQCVALLADPDARRKVSQTAWEMVSACYSWEVVARKFELLLV